MKYLFNVCILSALVAANNLSISDVFEEAPELVTLEDVYGSVAKGSAKGAQRLMKHSENYYRSRAPENCTFPLEIVILQDNTASFQDDFGEMRDVQLDLMVNALSVGHPDTKYAVVSFRDKPVYSLGEPAAGDYCLKFEAPLNADVSALKEVYDTLESNGGADPSEAQFTAIVAAAQSTTPGWTTTTDEPTRLIVVATDSPPHFADDGLNSYGMSRFSGVFDEANAEAQCLSEYYPDPAQVKNALAARTAYLAVLVYDGSWWAELPQKSWVWMNSYLGQSSEFVTSLTVDSSNFWSNLNHAIRAIEQQECVYTSTVAPPVTATLIPPATATLPPPAPCSPCVTPPCSCAAPAVEILLRHRPSHLKLLVENGKFNETNDIDNA